MSVSFLLGALNALAFLLCVGFLSYVVLIVVPYLRHRPGTSGDPRAYGWHLLVPCRNEEEVIAETVGNLRRAFPSAHVWCIDDASTDATASVLAGLSRRYARFHVVTRRLPDAAKGKGPALNAGWKAVLDYLPAGTDHDRVVVGVIDADARLEPDAAAVLTGSRYFGDPGVGAVQIQVRVRCGKDGPQLGAARRLLIRLQDLEFSGPIAAMQLLRRHAGSVGMGGNGQFTRLSILDHIAAGAGTPWHGALLEDFELGLHVLLGGSRTEYCHETSVLQDGVAELRPLLRQRSRWSQGSMQCFTYLRAILRSPAIPTMGAVELTYFLFLPWLQLTGGVVYLAAFAVMAHYALTDPGGLGAWWSNGAWGVLPLVILFGVAPFMLWGFIYRKRSDPSLGWLRAFGLGLANWLYGYLQQVASWWAVVRMLRGRHDWKKTVHARVDAEPDMATEFPAFEGSFVDVPDPADRTVVPAAALRARPALAAASSSRRAAPARFVVRVPVAVGETSATA